MRLTPTIRCLYDDADMYLSLSAWLESAGYKVIGATGFAPDERGKAEDSCALFVIIRREAEGSAARLCRLLREAAPRTPILVWSGTTSEDDLRASLESGADAYVAASTNLVDLTETISRLVRSAPPEGR